MAEAQLQIEHYWAGALRRAVIEGDVETGSVMAGQSVGMVKEEAQRRRDPRPADGRSRPRAGAALGPRDDARPTPSSPARSRRSTTGCSGRCCSSPMPGISPGGPAALRPGRILETAAGTGIVTAALLAAARGARSSRPTSTRRCSTWRRRRIASPTGRLPAGRRPGACPSRTRSFDLVVCQFGVMFFPDRIAAYREARRVLKPGGRFLFNAWDRIERNPVTDIAVAGAVAALFPDDPPGFFARVPFGYHDKARIEADLRAAGFTDIAAETVAMRAGSARRAMRPSASARGRRCAPRSRSAAGSKRRSRPPPPRWRRGVRRQRRADVGARVQRRLALESAPPF